MRTGKANGSALMTSVAVALVAGCTAGADAGGAAGLGRARQAHRTAATGAATFTPPPAQAQNLTIVGRQDFGGRGNFGDISVHRGYAYLGSFREPYCPGHGVSVASVLVPTRPTPVSTFAAHPNTSAEDIEVFTMSSPHFRGTVAAVGLQDCSVTPGEYGERGLELWDTTDPRRPSRLGFIPTSDLPQGGVHELDAFARDGRYYVIVASNFFAVEGTESPGPVRIIDVTNPRAPALVAGWHIGREPGMAYGSPLFADAPPQNCDAPLGGTSDCRAASTGGYPVVNPHSVSVNASRTRAYVAYWDAGMVVLDISDITRPRLIGRGNSGPEEEGDLHSAVEVPYFRGRVAITTDEDFSPAFNTEDEPGDVWGFARIWDISNLRRPVQIATIQSPHSASNRTDGYYAVHDPVPWGNLAFFSWYTDGIRVYDLVKPSAPRLLGFLDAPRVPQPHPGDVPIPTGAVWGLSVKPPFIYASDMNAGLYVIAMGPSILTRLRGVDHDDGFGGDD